MREPACLAQKRQLITICWCTYLQCINAVFCSQVNRTMQKISSWCYDWPRTPVSTKKPNMFFAFVLFCTGGRIPTFTHVALCIFCMLAGNDFALSQWFSYPPWNCGKSQALCFWRLWLRWSKQIAVPFDIQRWQQNCTELKISEIEAAAAHTNFAMRRVVDKLPSAL